MAARGWSVEKRWGKVVEWIRLGLGGGVVWPGLGRAKFVCAGFKTSEKFERYTKKPSPNEKHDFQIYRKFFAEKKNLGGGTAMARRNGGTSARVGGGMTLTLA